jgi:hypothetical protein
VIGFHLLSIHPTRYSRRMRKVSLTIAIFLAIALPSMAANMDQEYIQVRKIAMKDPRVREAFEKANERLNARILEIDPSLKPLVEKDSSRFQVNRQVPIVERHAAPTPPPKSTAHEHVVASGETLSSIAEHHHVPVAALKTANHITDERKLRVGQKLVIPATSQEQKPKPAQPEKPIQEANSDGNGNGGWWNELKKNL